MSINIDRSISDRRYPYKMAGICAKVVVTGRSSKTSILNLYDVAYRLNVSSLYILRHFRYELHRKVKIGESPDCDTINCTHSSQELQDCLDDFIKNFVLCDNCGLPTTEFFISKKRNLFKDCQECGRKSMITKELKLARYILAVPPHRVEKLREQKKAETAGTPTSEKLDETSPTAANSFEDSFSQFKSYFEQFTDLIPLSRYQDPLFVGGLLVQVEEKVHSMGLYLPLNGLSYNGNWSIRELQAAHKSYAEDGTLGNLKNRKHKGAKRQIGRSSQVVSDGITLDQLREREQLVFDIIKTACSGSAMKPHGLLSDLYTRGRQAETLGSWIVSAQKYMFSKGIDSLHFEIPAPTHGETLYQYTYRAAAYCRFAVPIETIHQAKVLNSVYAEWLEGLGADENPERMAVESVENMSLGGIKNFWDLPSKLIRSYMDKYELLHEYQVPVESYDYFTGYSSFYVMSDDSDDGYGSDSQGYDNLVGPLIRSRDTALHAIVSH